ncbi:acetate--CoA ligase family protein [Sulfuracidifex metallicus]|uniref:CoA-binding protein n=1 Tax=Sulfuracidifex metallicus DSM 6482 = JCM 9184 TaxID=523847 RepID=A0A6A9QGU5_SULME|nr:acetate--CoA ligase family protein [Sulfuracidifex metallicus]MUN28437.1 CoA-binding protein [Sulfuracidifex metallicus DSM 6482 = JCM 9184]WOE51047.1 acetate--CoA ligase family protein [Sulfuracidifex metallicus DSM 6482 = JCM 9184]
MEDLDPLFKPKSIAVIGASRNREKVGNVITRNLLSSFRGKIYPVNNKAESVEGLTAYKSVKDIKDDVDLGIISVPREAAVEVMEELGEKGVKASIVITAGFREVGGEGVKLEEELIHTALKYSIRFLGPNTMGLVSPEYNGTFAFADMRRGNIALVVQSGGIGAYMLDWAHKSRTGISYLVTMGNQADVKEYEVIQYLSEDPETKAIFAYVEGISDGEKFLEVMPESTKKKPVVFIKGGITSKGAKAAMSHTGSLAGSFDVFKAAVKTTGGILIEDFRDFLNLTKLVESSEPLKPEILVVTNSGGHGVLTSDAIERNNMTMITLPSRIEEELKKILPPTSSVRNPLDLTGDAGKDRYTEALKLVSDLDCTKVVIAESLPFLSTVEVAKAVLPFKGKGIVGVFMGGDEEFSSRIMESADIPCFNFPEDAVKSIRYLTSRVPPRKKIRISQPMESALELVKDKEFLKDYESMKLMEIYGIRTPKWSIVEDVDSAEKEADRIGYPLVMKISADSPVHKTEMKGVYMNVEKEQVKQIYQTLSKITKRVMLQEQLNGMEVFVGGIKDPVFGHTVVVGSGGIYVEVLKNVSYGICPVDEDEALDILKESKVYDMLNARKRGYDSGSVIRTITSVSRMMLDLNIKEMDINPLIVNEKGAFAVDVRLILK